MAMFERGQEIKKEAETPAPVVPNTLSISKEDLKELLSAVMSESRKMNPLDQKKYDEEIEKERRKAILVKQLGEDEERQINQRRNGCSHCVDEKTGQPVTRGSGIWCTQGQVHGNDVISLVCMRCSTVWYWKGTPQERAYAIDAEHGLLHFPPPAADRLLTDISS
jgi:hypothetical protein